MKPRIFSAARRSTLFSSIVFTCVSNSAFAASFVWDGTNNTWGSLHWNAGVAGPTGASNADSATINGGTVTFSGNDTFGNADALASPVITINSGGTLASGGFFNTMWDLTLNGGTLLANGGAHSVYGAFKLSGTVTVGGSVASNISLGSGINNSVTLGAGNQTGGFTTFNVADVTASTATDLTVSTVLTTIGTASGLIKAGAGTMTLTAANLYTGGTTVNGGTLSLAAAGALPSSGGVAIGAGGKLSNDGPAGNSFALYGLTMTGGELAATSAPHTSQGNFNLQGNVTVSGSVRSTISADLRIISNATRDFNVGSTGDISGVDLLISGRLGHENNIAWGYATKSGAGTMKLNGSPELGGMTVNAGRLILEDTAIGWTFPAAGLTNNSQLEFSVTSGSRGYSAGIGGTGALFKTGTGTLTLTAANAYTGATRIAAGTLNANSTSALGNGSATNTLIFTGGTLQAGGAITSLATRTVTLTSTGIIDTNNNAVSIAGVISGAGGLTKSGLGTLALSGVNTFTGGVVVNGGTLDITNGNTANAGGLMGASSVTVNNGATLRSAGSNAFYGWDGSGYNSDITVNAGGSLTMADGSDVGVRRVNLNGGTLATEGAASTNWGSWRFIVAGAGLSATANSTASATNMVFQNGADINVSTGVTLAITGTINTPSNGGTSTVIKNGAGTLALSGANAFSGNIVINNGTIAAGGYTEGNAAASISSNLGDLGTAVSRSITIQNGGILSLTNGNVLGTGGSTGTLSGVTLVVNPGGLFQSGLDGAVGGWWNKIGAVNLNGGTISIGSGANDTNFQGLALIGTVTVGGTTASTINNLGSSNSASNGIHLGQNGATVITFNVADVTGNSVSDLNVSAKLLNTSANLAASGLTKTGVGTMTLSGANSYSGTTTVSNGRLVYQNTYASASHAIAAGATLEINVATGTRNSATTTFSGVGTLVQSGAGTLIWGSGAATFALGAGSLIDVQGGTFIGGSSANEVWTNNLSSLNVATGAIFNGVEANVRVDALTGAGTIQSGYNGAGYANFTFGVNNGSGTFSGVLANSTSPGSFVKTGTGTQILSGANTYTGTTTINGGTLELNNAIGTIHYAGGTISINNGSTLKLSGGNQYWFDGKTVAFGAGGGTFDTGTSMNVVTGAPGLLFTTTAGTTSTIGGSSGINLNGSTDTFNVATTSTLNLTSYLWNAGSIIKQDGGILTLSGANTYTGNTTLSGGTLNITNAANTTPGVFVIGAGTTLNLASFSDYGVASAMGSRLAASETNSGTDSATTGIGLRFTGGTLQYTGSTAQSTNRQIRLLNVATNTIDASGTGSGTLSFTYGSANTNLFENGGARTLILTGSNTGANTFAIGLADAGGATSLTKSGAGTWVLTGTNTNTGTTTINDGTLTVSGGSAIADSSAVVLANVAGAIFNLANSETIGSLAGGGTTGGNVIMGANSLTTGGNDTTTTYSGVISGAGSLTKTGTGTLTLGGLNSYTGATTINAGKLVIGGSVTSNVTVASGATVGGSGTITGNLSLSGESSAGAGNGGILAAGNSPGVLTATGTTNFNTGSIFAWELDSSQANPETNRGIAYDGVNTSGVTGSGGIFQVVLQGTQGFGDAFWSSAHIWSDIFTTNGTTPVTSDLASVFSSFSYANGGGALANPSAIGSFTLTGSSLSWSAVPEPSSALAGLLLGAGLLRRRRSSAAAAQ